MRGGGGNPNVHVRCEGDQEHTYPHQRLHDDLGRNRHIVVAVVVDQNPHNRHPHEHVREALTELDEPAETLTLKRRGARHLDEEDEDRSDEDENNRLAVHQTPPVKGWNEKI